MSDIPKFVVCEVCRLLVEACKCEEQPPLSPGQEVWVKVVVESIADTAHVIVMGRPLYTTLNGECLSVPLSAIHPAPPQAKKGEYREQREGRGWGVRCHAPHPCWCDSCTLQVSDREITSLRAALAARDAVIREYMNRCDRCISYGNWRGTIKHDICDTCTKALALIGGGEKGENHA